MKSFTSQFDKLNKGLRRFSNSPVNAEELVECFNLAPDEAGLELHEIINLPSAAISWGGTGKYTEDIFVDYDADDFVDIDGDEFIDY